MSAVDYTLLLLALGILLATSRALGELAGRMGMPTVLGEISAGVLLGPTVLGHFVPAFSEDLFPQSGVRGTVFDGLFMLSIVLFMLVAGLEVDLSSAWRQGKTAVIVSAGGIALPFCIGFGAATLWPAALGQQSGASPLIFALFMATALSISALPVIAKTLMDLGIYFSDLGVIVISAAILSDLFGWIFFAIILGMMNVNMAHPGGVGITVAMVIGYAIFALTGLRWLIHKSLPWVQAHTSHPGGVLGLALSMALCGAAFTEWAGVHGIFGAFLAGVAIGDSPHLRNYTRTIMRQFISFFFAPLFFASIGLKVDFVAHFDVRLTVIVIALACIGKIVACGGAGLLAGLPRREALAVGFALNARGAMEIILGTLALRYGVIGEELFVALVIMALVTSVLSAVSIPTVLRRPKPRTLEDYLSSKTYVGELKSGEMTEAIAELSAHLGATVGIAPKVLAQAVWEREQTASTALGNGVAVPHARVAEATTFTVGTAVTRRGIDFNAPDGKPAHVLFFIISPKEDDGSQLEILADIAERFSDPGFSEKIVAAGSYTEFLAILRTRGH